MHFAHDTEIALAGAAALVNTLSDGVDALQDQAGLDAFLRAYPFSGSRSRSDDELAQVRRVREQLRTLWGPVDRDESAAIVNALLHQVEARPCLSRHDQWDWHLHMTEPDAPLAQRIGAEAAMGFLDLVRSDDLGRLRICAAEDCEDVLVDLSKNKSRRYCADGNCGNRAHVAAYRARKRGGAG